MPILKLTWGTSLNPCPFCSRLNGYQWIFISGARNMPRILAALGRNVWDLATHTSHAHGGAGRNCRCGLHVTVDLRDVYQFAQALREAL